MTTHSLPSLPSVAHPQPLLTEVRGHPPPRKKLILQMLVGVLVHFGYEK